MWGKGERDVSYTSTKAITHRNALVNLKKLISYLIQKAPEEGETKFRMTTENTL